THPMLSYRRRTSDWFYCHRSELWSDLRLAGIHSPTTGDSSQAEAAGLASRVFGGRICCEHVLYSGDSALFPTQHGRDDSRDWILRDLSDCGWIGFGGGTGSGSAQNIGRNHGVSNWRALHPNNMFKLDEAISEWRRQMSAAGIMSSDVLDELESHLREDVEHRMRSGATVERAFREALQRVGAAENLNVEFAKVRRPDARLSHNTMRICCLAVAAYVFVVETWTLLAFDISMRGRIFGIGVVAMIAGFIGFLPELKRLLWPGVRGRAAAKAIYTVCSYVSVAWVCLLFLGEGYIGILS